MAMRARLLAGQDRLVGGDQRAQGGVLVAGNRIAPHEVAPLGAVGADQPARRPHRPLRLRVAPVRVPGTEEFLINPYGLMFDEITASTLVKIDAEGKIKDDPVGMGVNEAGFIIHSCMHAARPEIHCVIHTHTRSGVAVSAMKCGLLPISQHAMRVHAEITYHDYEGVALYKEEQARMARDLGKKSKAMMLRNHGVLALGETVREAFEIMYYLDCACQIQVDALAGGMPNVQLMSDQAAEVSTAALQRPMRPAQQ